MTVAEHESLLARAVEIAARYDLPSPEASMDGTWLRLILRMRRKFGKGEDKDLWRLNSETLGVEFRTEKTGPCIVALHPVVKDATVDDDEIRFLCLQLRRALDAYATTRGLNSTEVVVGT